MSGPVSGVLAESADGGAQIRAGRAIAVGDVVVFSGTPHRVAAIEPYDLHGACGIARASDGWGITLFPNVPLEVT
jgi:hypothetical protein